MELIVERINERFEQKSCTIFPALESFLFTAIHEQNLDKSTFKLVEDKYSDEADIFILSTEMSLLKQIFIDNAVCFSDIVSHLRALKKRLNITGICNLLLVNPATYATPERSFSMARRIETCLRSTMTQSRLNSLTILHCYKLGTDNLDLAVVAQN